MKKGILLALLTAVISGISIFYSKIAVAKIDPLVLTTSRNLWVGLVFLLVWGIRDIGAIKKIKRKDIVNLILIGVVGGAVPFYLFFTGLKFTNSLAANFIHKTLFIWVSFLAVIFLKEKLNIKYIISFLLIFVGNLFLAPKIISFGKGELMILAATLLWTVENIMAKKILKNVSSELVGLSRMGIGSLLLLTMSLASGKGSIFLSLNINQIVTILIGGTLLAFYVFVWFKALKYAPVSLVTMVLTFSIVVGNILNGSFAGVKLTVSDMYSSIILTGAVFIIIFMRSLDSLRSLGMIKTRDENG